MPSTSLEMNNQFRQKSLIFLMLTIIGMLLLAASLHDLHFQPGMPIPGAENSQVPDKLENESIKSVIEFQPVLQLPLALIFIWIMIVFVFSLIKKFNLKKNLKLAGVSLIVLCLFLFLNQIKITTPASSTGDSQGMEIPDSLYYDLAPIGDPPKVIFWFVIISLICVTAFLVIWLLIHPQHQSQKENLISNETNKALKAIESGCDLRNVIINCYMQMLRITEEEQGIERLNSMTPREFEQILTAKGIPYASIHQLTDLFEKVRYGSKPTNLSDEKTAIECLSAIRLSCRSGDWGLK